MRSQGKRSYKQVTTTVLGSEWSLKPAEMARKHVHRRKGLKQSLRNFLTPQSLSLATLLSGVVPLPEHNRVNQKLPLTENKCVVSILQNTSTYGLLFVFVQRVGFIISGRGAMYIYFEMCRCVGLTYYQCPLVGGSGGTCPPSPSFLSSWDDSGCRRRSSY